MVVKFLKPSVSFAGIFYNLNKVAGGRAELMKAANFGIASGLSSMKLQDYINYLEMITSLNKRIEYPQLHVVVSGKGRLYDKVSLTGIAEGWMKEMGYEKQPYILVYHKDTANNHLHIVSTRIDRDGEKIDSGFERKRSRTAIDYVLGYDIAMKYRFSTKAQFFMVLESFGFPGKDPDELKVLERASRYKPNKKRAAEIRSLLEQYQENAGMKRLLKERFHIDLLYHSSGDKAAYGYSVIDHEHRIVFKGGEIMPLKELLRDQEGPLVLKEQDDERDLPQEWESGTYIPPVMISDDVDDQQIHGMRRRRQKKARTNTR